MRERCSVGVWAGLSMHMLLSTSALSRAEGVGLAEGLETSSPSNSGTELRSYKNSTLKLVSQVCTKVYLSK